MKTVRDIIADKNDLVMQMAFSVDVDEVRVIMKQVRKLEQEIKEMTLN